MSLYHEEASWNLLHYHYSYPSRFKSTANSNVVKPVRVLRLICRGGKVPQEIFIFSDWKIELNVMGKPVSKDIWTTFGHFA